MRYIKLPKEQRRIIRAINGLKTKLRATDYQAIKYAEGEMSVGDYAPVKAQRVAWRKEINELQAQFQAMQATE